MTEICNFCKRNVDELTEHHLIPKSEAKRNKLKIDELPVALLCRQCHKKIHSLYSNRKLADEFNTLDKLRATENMTKYLKWVEKIPGTQIIKEHK